MSAWIDHNAYFYRMPKYYEQGTNDSFISRVDSRYPSQGIQGFAGRASGFPSLPKNKPNQAMKKNFRSISTSTFLNSGHYESKMTNQHNEASTYFVQYILCIQAASHNIIIFPETT